MTALELITAYYSAFNAGNMEGFLTLLHPEVVHDINQGRRETGKETFARFMQHMNRCYRETVSDLAIMVNQDGSRAAAEFRLDGRYLETDGDFLPAKGQRYRLRVGAFFAIRDGRIARISNHYNLKDWQRQVAR